MWLQGTFDLPLCTSHERHDHAFVAQRTHRNGEPPFGAHEHKDHPNLRQNHRPEDKPRHGNLVAQVGGYGEEYLPSHLVTLKQHTDERRKEYYHDGRAGQYRRNRHDRVGNLRTVREVKAEHTPTYTTAKKKQKDEAVTAHFTETTKMLLAIFRRTVFWLYFVYGFIILPLLFKFQNVYLFL